MIPEGPTPSTPAPLGRGVSIKPIAANYTHPAMRGAVPILLWTGQCSWAPGPPGSLRLKSWYIIHEKTISDLRESDC